VSAGGRPPDQRDPKRVPNAVVSLERNAFNRHPVSAGEVGILTREMLAHYRLELWACCESLAGQKDQAIAHLRRAIELSERARPFLESDSDLDPIRQDPAFQELLPG